MHAPAFSRRRLGLRILQIPTCQADRHGLGGDLAGRNTGPGQRPEVQPQLPARHGPRSPEAVSLSTCLRQSTAACSTPAERAQRRISRSTPCAIRHALATRVRAGPLQGGHMPGGTQSQACCRLTGARTWAQVCMPWVDAAPQLMPRLSHAFAALPHGFFLAPPAGGPQQRRQQQLAQPGRGQALLAGLPKRGVSPPAVRIDAGCCQLSRQCCQLRGCAVVGAAEEGR